MKISDWAKKRTYSDWIFAVVVLVVLFLRGPMLIEQFRQEGKTLTPTLVDGKTLPLQGEKTILIFWATWCGPCSVELGRINSAIEKKEISAGNIYAVNMGEDHALIARTVKEKKYLFNVVRDNGALAGKLGVAVTPTIAFVNKDNSVKWLSSGLSPSLIYRIQYFQQN